MSQENSAHDITPVVIEDENIQANKLFYEAPDSSFQ